MKKNFFKQVMLIFLLVLLITKSYAQGNVHYNGINIIYVESEFRPSSECGIDTIPEGVLQRKVIKAGNDYMNGLLKGSAHYSCEFFQCWELSNYLVEKRENLETGEIGSTEIICGDIVRYIIQYKLKYQDSCIFFHQLNLDSNFKILFKGEKPFNSDFGKILSPRAIAKIVSEDSTFSKKYPGILFFEYGWNAGRLAWKYTHQDYDSNFGEFVSYDAITGAVLNRFNYKPSRPNDIHPALLPD